MKTKRQRERAIKQRDAWRDELQTILDKSNWSAYEYDRVEELASLLEYSEEDKFWHS